ncbi:MAG: carbohydrate ABC transporter permease [Clostridium sp.]|nr:carbohydrate ABC transporter permease [Clostridium sp.]
MGSSRKRRAFEVFNYLLLTFMGVISLLPVWHILMKSFSAPESVEAGLVKLLPVNFSTFSYEFILQKKEFYTAFFVSVKRVLLGVPLQLLCTILAAYPLSKEDSQLYGRRWYVTLFIITMVFSGGMIPTYMVVKYTGLLNTIWSLILPGAVSVFNILILMNFFRDLPKEIEESALIDGAGHFTIMARLFLPLAKPALATIVLFIFVNHWNSWFDGLIYMSLQKDFPLQTYLQSILTVPDIQNMTTEQLSQLGKVSRAATNAAQIVISSVPILIIYPFLQRYYTKGLTLGSVKG